MDGSKDDDAYPNDVPLELEVSQINGDQSTFLHDDQLPSPKDDSVESCLQRERELQNKLLRFLILRQQQTRRKAPLSDSEDMTTRAAEDGIVSHDNDTTGSGDDDNNSQQDSDVASESGMASGDELEEADTTDLPQVPGPKLARFRPIADPLDICFEEPLHDGRFSHIWKVSCRGYDYALKIFKPGKWFELLEKWNTDDCPLPQGWRREDLKPYTDPFFNECRVYGRLKETNKENLAMNCHGYVMFSSVYLEEKGIDLGTSTTSDPDSVRSSEPGIIHEGLPEEPVGHGSKLVYALIKDLPPSLGMTPERPTESEVKQMSRDLLALHKLGIFHASISHSSYVTGKLVDFSTAQTVPSPWLDGYYRGMNPVRIGKDPAFSDQVDFDEKIVNYWNIQTEIITPKLDAESKDKNGRTKRQTTKGFARVFTPEQKTYRRLRSGKDRQFLANLRLGEGWFNPSKYKWAGEGVHGSRLGNHRTSKRRYSNSESIVNEETAPSPLKQVSAKKREVEIGEAKSKESQHDRGLDRRVFGDFKVHL